MTKTWLMRRDVRSPVAEGTTAPSSSSVWRLPFISASTSPARASSTAFAAAAWLCGTDTTRYEPRSTPSAWATARILSSGPTSTGVISPRRAASIGPSSESRSQGWTTAQGHRRQAFAGLEQAGESIPAAQTSIPAAPPPCTRSAASGRRPSRCR